jgi:hypothetical protein
MRCIRFFYGKSGVTRSKVASPNSGSHRSCWVEASHASPDLSSNSRMVGSCRPMPYKPRIRLSFAIVYYPGDGTPGQSASHVRENLIKAWPSDSIDPTRPATPHPERHGAGHTTLQPSPAPPPRQWAATEGSLGRAGLSHLLR